MMLINTPSSTIKFWLNTLTHNFKVCILCLIELCIPAFLLSLPGNPWSCDCELHRVFSKILHVRHLHIDDYRNVTCQDPPQLMGASLAWVDSQLCVAETATVLVITVTMLVTVVAALVMAERNRKRNRGKNWDTESQTQTHSPPSWGKISERISRCFWLLWLQKCF